MKLFKKIGNFVSRCKEKVVLGVAGAVAGVLSAYTPARAAFDLTTFTLDAGPVESLILIILAALGTIWAGKYLLSFMKRG